MKMSHVYLLEEAHAGGAIWEGTAVYRDEKEAKRVWRSSTIEAIRKAAREREDEPPKDLEDLTDGDLATTAEYYSEVGFYDLTKIDFYE